MEYYHGDGIGTTYSTVVGGVVQAGEEVKHQEQFQVNIVQQSQVYQQLTSVVSDRSVLSTPEPTESHHSDYSGSSNLNYQALYGYDACIWPGYEALPNDYLTSPQFWPDSLDYSNGVYADNTKGKPKHAQRDQIKTILI